MLAQASTNLLDLVESLQPLTQDIAPRTANKKIFHAGKSIIDWSTKVDLHQLSEAESNMFRYMMTICGNGMTGKGSDAASALRKLATSLMVFKASLKKRRRTASSSRKVA